MLKELTKESFQNEVLKNDHLKIVQFRNQWNGTCQIIAPIYEDLARSYEGRADFFQVDIETQKDLEQEYGIIEVPTILFFDHGRLVDYSKGLIPKNSLIQKIEDALNKFN